MDKIGIGIICPSEIAFRRFMATIIRSSELEYVGVAYPKPQKRFNDGNTDLSVISNSIQRAKMFQDNYGGKIFEWYQNIITSDEIDTVYPPLPPVLPHRWAKMALKNGKHVSLEKISLEDTMELVALADAKELVLHENYMFVYHKQIKEIRRLAAKIGDVRLYQITFGFPERSGNDFRYNKTLGGGAHVDWAVIP